MMEWQPIETAPKDGSVIIVWYFSPLFARWCYVGKGEKKGWASQDYWLSDDFEEYKPTHWMPLPQPPTKAN